MKRNQLTITYPTKDAHDLQQTLQHLKIAKLLVSFLQVLEHCCFYWRN